MIEDSAHTPPPGTPLREAHAHVFQHGRSLSMIQLGDCEAPAEMLDRIAAAARAPDAEAVLLGQGARPESWQPADWPALADLDRVTGDRPCCCWCFDYHALIANSAMLRLARIDRGTPDPPGGIIGRDRDGALTGVVYESAALAVWNAVPEPPESDRAELLRRAVDDLARHGFVEIHDLKSQTWLGPALRPIAEATGVRFVLYPLLEDLPAVLKSRSAWESGLVRLGGAKLFVDGTLNSRTAWMLEPFADGRPEHPRGTPMVAPDAIAAAVHTCEEHGLGLATHAIGDAAVRAVLDAIEAEGRGGPHRIEHAELIHPADIPRFAKLGVVCSVQPCHLLYDIEALRRAVPDRLDRVLPLRSLIDTGCTPGELLWFGSDTPIVRPDPGDSLQAAIERRRANASLEEAITADESVTPAEAVLCFRG